MRFRCVSRFLILFLLSLCLSVAPLIAEPSGSRPNIIFILCDDLGYGDLGVLFQSTKSGKRHLTPNLDTLASEGIILNQHYCPAPVCAPSRASLLLGVHQGHVNIRDNQFDKALEDNHTLGTTLQEAGYATALIGKYGMQGSGSSPAAWAAYPTKRGFDTFFGYVRHGDGHTHYPAHVTDSRGTKELYDQDQQISDDLEGCYTADLFTARAKKQIIDHSTNNPAQPFFIYLAYDTPHAALQLPATNYPAGGGLTGGLVWNGTPSNMINTANGAIDSYRHPDYTTAVGDAWTDVEERFATSVRRIDDGVGDIIQTLKDLNIDTNTVVVFSSDNGPHNESYLSANYAPTSFDSYGMFEGIKRDTLEGGVRMPTLARWPGVIPAGSTNNSPSQFHDWMPTFCDVAGLPGPARSDGVSLVPVLTGVETNARGMVYIEYENGSSTPNYGDFSNHKGEARGEMQVIHMDGYKGIRRNISTHSDVFEVYDINTDFSESLNLASSSSYFVELQERMKNRVLQIRRPNSTATRPYDNEYVPSSGAGGSNGLAYAVYEGDWPWVPLFDDLTAATTGTAATIDLSVRTRDDDVGVAYSGYVGVPSDGDYTFFLTSDSGALLRIHEATVIDDDFNHDGTEQSGAIRLQRGLHPISIAYVHTNGSHALDVQYSGPSISKQTIPASAFYLTATGRVTTAATNGYTWGGAGSRTTPETWDSASNADSTHWNNASAPTLDGPSITIPAGGLSMTGAFTLSSTGRVTMTGGYLRRANAGIEVGGSALFDLQNGYVDAQFIKPMGSGTLRIGGGFVELTGANEPLATASTGYLDFTGDSGVFSLPYKNSAYFDGKLSAGRIRIDGQTVAGTGSVNAINGRYFDNDIDTAYVLVEAESYREQVMLGTNPLVYAMCDEGGDGGYLLDSSGRGNHADSVTGGTFGQPGVISNGVAFAGAGSVVLGTSLNPGINDFSIELFLNVKTLSTDAQVVVAQKDGSGTGRSVLTVGNTGALSSFLAGKSTLSGVTLASNRWYHVVMTVDENGANDVIAYYVDGAVTPGGGTANIGSANGAWVLGAHKDQGMQFFTGALDEFAFYDRVLTPEEVYAHYRASPLATPPGMIFIVR